MFFWANHGDFQKITFAFHGQVETHWGWGDLCSFSVPLIVHCRERALNWEVLVPAPQSSQPCGHITYFQDLFYYTLCDWTFEKYLLHSLQGPSTSGSSSALLLENEWLRREKYWNQAGQLKTVKPTSPFPVHRLSLAPWPGFILRDYFYTAPDPAKPWGSANLTRFRLHLCFLYNLWFLGKGAYHKKLH